MGITSLAYHVCGARQPAETPKPTMQAPWAPVVFVVRKPSSVRAERRRCARGNHSSRTAVTDGLQQPTRRLERAALLASPCDEADGFGLPCVCLCGLAPNGVCHATFVTEGAVGSYSTFSPSPRGVRCQARGAVSFLLHSPRCFHHRALPGIALFGARTFLPRACARRRSPGRRRRAESSTMASATQRRKRPLGLPSWVARAPPSPRTARPPGRSDPLRRTPRGAPASLRAPRSRGATGAARRCRRG